LLIKNVVRYWGAFAMPRGRCERQREVCEAERSVDNGATRWYDGNGLEATIGFQAIRMPRVSSSVCYDYSGVQHHLASSSNVVAILALLRVRLARSGKEADLARPPEWLPQPRRDWPMGPRPTNNAVKNKRATRV
jgi:hypothetical protein